MHPVFMVFVFLLMLFAIVMGVIQGEHSESPTMGEPLMADIKVPAIKESKLLPCVLIGKSDDFYRFIVKDGDNERFIKLPIGVVREIAATDRFFHRNALEIRISQGKSSNITYYRP